MWTKERLLVEISKAKDDVAVRCRQAFEEGRFDDGVDCGRRLGQLRALEIGVGSLRWETGDQVESCGRLLGNLQDRTLDALSYSAGSIYHVTRHVLSAIIESAPVGMSPSEVLVEVIRYLDGSKT